MRTKLIHGWMNLALPLLVAAVVGCNSGGESGGGTAFTDPSGKASSSGSGSKRIVFLTNGDDPYWDTCNAGLKEAAKEMNVAADGYTVVMDKGNFKPEGQIDKLRQYATEPDVVGIAISVVQADNRTIADQLRELQKQGKKIITVDGDVNLDRYRDARTYYIGTDNFVAGQTLGKAGRELLKAKGVDKGGYVQFVGYTDNDNARKRMDGVKDAIGTEYEEIARRADQGDRDKARDNVRTALDNEGDRIAALFGIWAYNAPAIAGVVEERKVRDKTLVGTFDAASDAIKTMGDGNIDVMVVQNPFEMGQKAVKLLKAMCDEDKAVTDEMFPNMGQPDGDIYTTGLRVVVPDESSSLKADQFDQKIVEFMTLKDFEAWLQKYGLKSS
jgi:ribose transport system substrate-binding protein